MTTTNIVSNGSDMGELIRQIAELKAANELLKAKAAARQQVSFKVSDKGAVSIYGLGRFPVTLYLSQFEALDKRWGDLRDFVEANRSKLATKD